MTPEQRKQVLDALYASKNYATTDNPTPFQWEKTAVACDEAIAIMGQSRRDGLM